MERPCITEKGNQKVLLVDGKPFIMLAGEIHNSDSSSPAYMEQIWKIADDLGMNSLLLPVTWEMVEPVEGEFHFEVLDQLIDQAREYGMKIGILWFGSFKNAECMYAPEWVKRDLERFHRGQIVKGKNKAGRRVSPTLPVTIPYTTISYLSENAMQADARAFGKMMQHVREYDEAEGTVITVQVENETGLLGNAREVSDEADAAFAGEVPQKFASYMRSHTEYMEEDVRAAVEAGAEKGSWSEVFGAAAEEIFSRRAGGHPQHQRAERQTAQSRGTGHGGQKSARAGLFGREALQRIAEAARQQGICPAEEHQREACPAGPQRKADTSQHQRPAPGQKCRTKPAGPEPSGGHGRPHSAEQAEAVQRKCPEPVEQDAQRSSGCAGSKAVRRQAQCQPQPKGEQSPVENGPAPGKPQRKGPALPQGRAYRRPGGQRGGNRLLRVQFCGFRHEKIPAFRRGSFAMFCFPRPLHIL